MSDSNSEKYLEHARSVIQSEIDGLNAVRNNLDAAFVQLVELCLRTLENDGKIVLTGVGKSGHIGHKLAATLSSTGSNAAFLHPVEAMHGDLGILGRNDLLLSLSYSGETDELLQVLPSAKRFRIPIAAITGDPESQLAKWCDLVVPMRVPGEACPFNLAPTTTTTAMLAIGDALAMVLLETRGFSKEDYGRLHPSGSIGRSVTLRVADVMRSGDRLPTAAPECAVKDALATMTRCRSGSVLVNGNDDKLLGIFTDGDFRRLVQESTDFLQAPIQEVMTRDPKRVRDDQMAIEILNLLETTKIDDIPVVDSNDRAVGLVDIQDLPKFKLM